MGDEHVTELRISLPVGGLDYAVFQNGRKLELRKSQNWDYPRIAEIKTRRGPTRVEIRRLGQ
jgi:hypothetical protein